MTGGEPVLSVTMPVYNARETVVRAVQSVLDSTWTNLELVIVDDGSTDGTAERLVELSASDPRIQVICRDHRGVVATANEAIACAKSDWIARMDADDVCLPDRFQKQFDAVKTHGWDGAGGMVEVVNQEGLPVPSWQRYQTWVNENHDPTSIAAFRFVELPLVNPTMLARRDVWELEYREGPWPEDYDFWLRALHRGFRFGKVPEPVLQWMDHPARLTRANDRYSENAFDRCRRLHLKNGPLRDVATVDLWGAGQTGKPWLRWILEEGFQVRKIIEVSPRKVGLELYGVPMVGPEELPPSDGTPLIVAVGAEGAREMILDHIRPLGFVPGRDTWFVA